MLGTITHVSGRGWFFCKCDEDQSGVFVAQKNIEKRRYLQVDDRISFDRIPSTKNPNDFEAINVKYLGHIVARQIGSEVKQ